MAETANPGDRSPIDKLTDEIRRMGQSLPNFTLFLGATVLWVLHFHIWGNSARGYVDTPSLFGWLNWVYEDPDSTYGRYVPLIFLFLMYWKRDDWIGVPKGVWFPAMGLVVLGAVLHYVGFLIQLSRVSFLGFLIGWYGIIGLFYGFRFMVEIFFPFFIFIFCMPLPADLDGLTLPLRVLVSTMAVGFSDAVFGVDVIRQGTTLICADGSFAYDVAPACSGIRSLTSLFMLTSIFAFTGYLNLWKKVVVIASAIPLAIFGNWLRLTTVIMVAEFWGQDAGKAIEQNLGFLTFAVALVGVILLSRVLEDPPPPAGPADPAPGDLKPEPDNQPA
jgi:exosortase